MAQEWQSEAQQHKEKLNEVWKFSCFFLQSHGFFCKKTFRGFDEVQPPEELGGVLEVGNPLKNDKNCLQVDEVELI